MIPSPGVTTSFAYNGDGIRLRLVEAGTLTTYTQDYAAPLPVVLQAKTGSASTQYVYSLGTRPVAEYEAAWEYLLPDPLGSVRQIANTSGNVTLLKSYEPYGSVLNSQGVGMSVFGYTGEQVDAYIKLVFLRARYYSPEAARFLTKDVWQGDYTRPQTLNGWIYVEGNPINRVDPTGQQSELEKLYIRHLYYWYIRDATHRLNDRVLTNLSDNAFASMIAAKILVEDATFLADNPQGILRWGADVLTFDLTDLERDLLEQLAFGGEHSWGPANIPLPLAERGLKWWEQNYANLPSICFAFENVDTWYYTLRDDRLLRLLWKSERQQLVSELMTDSGAVQATALAILESSGRARSYWRSIGEPSHELSAYTIALGVIGFSQPDEKLYILSAWESKGFHWNWVEAIDDAGLVLGLQLLVPTDYLPYTDEERQRLDVLPEG